MQYLQSACGFLGQPYLDFLAGFRFEPAKHVHATFHPLAGHKGEEDDDQVEGDVEITVKGLWVDTILYEIPLLALASEAYFRFVDTDWTHDSQEDKAYAKGMRLLEAGCTFSEYGTRRRRDFKTHYLVIRGLMRARADAEELGFAGRLSGTSNVHLAREFGITPKGTVGHEWFMGVAAITGYAQDAVTTALTYWLGCFGKNGGVWKVVPTDTFGTTVFLKSFRSPMDSTSVHSAEAGVYHDRQQTFADAFIGVRHDSGDPLEFIETMRRFYDQENIKERKTIVFSDSLNVASCLKYKGVAETAGFDTAFGIGTDFTNDFARLGDAERSTPLNIVMKLRAAGGVPAVKLSDSTGKHSGDKGVIERVKTEMGYSVKSWQGNDESRRWGKNLY